MFAIQYLEGGARNPLPPVRDIRSRLREAFARLPITLVLVGWDLPMKVVGACASECERAGAHLYRWHPLLTDNAGFKAGSEWRAIGLDGQPGAGFQGLPEFTFACPNRPLVRETVLSRLEKALRDGPYQGVFLDRIRFPSPAGNPASSLACFCDDCRRIAGEAGLDLGAAQQRISQLIATPDGAMRYIQALLGEKVEPFDPALEALAAVMDFRSQCVSDFVQAAAEIAQDFGLAVGLDCFSTSLTCMVGQDLAALDACCDWIKIMSYGHTMGPAGIPFELLGLASWLIERHDVAEAKALACLSQATGLPLPESRAQLREEGLLPQALHAEARHARQAGVGRLLAGIELVDVEGITHLSPPQIAADVTAFHTAGVDGLALSWDLWHIPLERLELIQSAWVVTALSSDRPKVNGVGLSGRR